MTHGARRRHDRRDQRLSEVGSRLDRRPTLVGHLVGLSLAVCGVGIVGSSFVELANGGPHVGTMLATGATIAGVGYGSWRVTRVPDRIGRRDVFVAVTVAWVAMALAGATPYWVTGTLDSVDDAVFEAVAGFTTTGATVLRPIEAASDGILFWRSITQWLGGMGVIVLVVAVLPTVGSGGMHLLEAEAPGEKGERLTPRVTQTAQRLWWVYLGFTVIVALAYLVAGMDAYDATVHSFTTVSTGGFSSYNASLGHFDSAAIEWIAIVAMFLAGTSFTLLYRLLRGKPGPLLRSVEFRLYCMVVALAVLIVFIAAGGERSLEQLRASVFVVVSVVSTTGYATADYALWDQGAQAVVLVLIPLGAMAGSTAGGVKMLRVLAIASFAHREALRQMHPTLVRPVRIGSQTLDDRIANKVVGFFILTLAAFGGSGLLIALSGTDPLTAFSSAATLFGNVGPGLGDVGPTEDFANLPRFGRGIGIATMLLGRLEIYPVLIALAAIPLGPAPRVLRRARGTVRSRALRRTG
ncbi:MAG: TrkH family potassium uptake protein [Actinomycetota bacterium]